MNKLRRFDSNQWKEWTVKSQQGRKLHLKSCSEAGRLDLDFNLAPWLASSLPVVQLAVPSETAVRSKPWGPGILFGWGFRRTCGSLWFGDPLLRRGCCTAGAPKKGPPFFFWANGQKSIGELKSWTVREVKHRPAGCSRSSPGSWETWSKWWSMDWRLRDWQPPRSVPHPGPKKKLRLVTFLEGGIFHIPCSPTVPVSHTMLVWYHFHPGLQVALVLVV